MNTATLNFKALPISERIQLVEDIWDSIAQETPGPLTLSAEEEAELKSVKDNLQQLEQALFRRLRNLDRWPA